MPAVNHLVHELAAIRAGRANPAILDKVAVDYYGSPTPINQIAAVAVAEARILTITPWDRQMLKPISKALQTSDIGITPSMTARSSAWFFPAPTEERRKQLTKEVQKQGEEAKVAVRNVRRDAMDKFKAMKKAGELTEDDPEEAGRRDPKADRQVRQTDRRDLRRQKPKKSWKSDPHTSALQPCLCGYA